MAKGEPALTERVCQLLFAPSLVFLDTDWAMGPQGGAQEGEGDRKPVYLG